jgi:hypothetical protein
MADWVQLEVAEQATLSKSDVGAPTKTL